LLAPTDDRLVGGAQARIGPGVRGHCRVTLGSLGVDDVVNGLEPVGDLDAHLHGHTVLRAVPVYEDILPALDDLSRTRGDIDTLKKGNELLPQISPLAPVTNHSHSPTRL